MFSIIFFPLLSNCWYIMQVFKRRKAGGNSGSKKETWATCCGGETALGKASHGLDLSHCVAMWFGASHISSPVSLSPPQKEVMETHKLDPRSS